jgi:hypothetical protein
MASGAPRPRRLVRNGWTGLLHHSSWILGVLLGAWIFFALRWTMPGTFLGDVSSQHLLYFAAKPFHVGVDADGVGCLLQCPTTYSYQMRGQDFLPGDVLSHHYSGQWCRFGDVKIEHGYLVEC